LLYATFAVVDVFANYGFFNEVASNLVMVRNSTTRDIHKEAGTVLFDASCYFASNVKTVEEHSEKSVLLITEPRIQSQILFIY
jgi:hypothetical protein